MRVSSLKLTLQVEIFVSAVEQRSKQEVVGNCLEVSQKSVECRDEARVIL